ncbi:MAG: hypothetical protein HC926_05440 [Synechococcaceae cyanobacterium SM2_3_60]|nr:hypothetical protein [Synechococcaceae cyanobacterium SM2_3_60]
MRDAIPAQYYETAVKIGSRSLKNIDTPVTLYAFPALKSPKHAKQRLYQWLMLASGGVALLAIANRLQPASPPPALTTQSITSIGNANRTDTPARSVNTNSPPITNSPSIDELAVGIASTVDAETAELPSSDTAAATSNDYAPFTLSPGFQWARGTGNTGGPRLASEAMGIALTSTGKCNGYIDSLPDHRLTLTSDFDYLSVTALTEGYASLVITGPNAEVWCATTQNPGIEGFYERGIYDIYIGNLRQGLGPRYELVITELP